MSSRRARLLIALVCTSVTLFQPTAHGQPPPAPPDDLESEVSAIKAENAALREQVSRLEEQQKALVEMLDDLRKRLDDSLIASEPDGAAPPTLAPTVEPPVPSTA